MLIQGVRNNRPVQVDLKGEQIAPRIIQDHHDKKQAEQRQQRHSDEHSVQKYDGRRDATGDQTAKVQVHRVFQ